MNEDKNLNNENWLTFSINYNAENKMLEEHRLPADRLVSAVREMERLISRADKTLNGSKKTLNLYVSAPAVEGSYGIEFFAELINPENAKAMLQAIGILSPAVGAAQGVAKSLFSEVQKIEDSTTIEIETFDDKDEAVLKFDGKKEECPENVARLVGNPSIRKALHNVVVEPIEDYDSPSFKVTDGKGDKAKTSVSLNNEQITKIDNLLKLDIPNKDYTYNTTVTFGTVNFDGKKGWKMKLDGKSVDVEIADDEFLKRTEQSRQNFSKSDEFDVELRRTISYQKDGTEKTSYTLLKAKGKPKLK